ncbi:hypothetical protein EVA_21102 [gut metagenome]|uniref:Uncharacterized protein n=1 Tax=gut metagenome TaxID=749906 RepID=J9F7B2_9ZZZZ
MHPGSPPFLRKAPSENSWPSCAHWLAAGPPHYQIRKSLLHSVESPSVHPSCRPYIPVQSVYHLSQSEPSPCPGGSCLVPPPPPSYPAQPAWPLPSRSPRCVLQSVG